MRPLPISVLAAAVALLAAPTANAHVLHTVSPGDTLWSIAAQSNLTTRTVAVYNGLTENSNVVLGTPEYLLVTNALRSARLQSQLDPEVHPVKLVMEALFEALPLAPNDQPPRTPPLRRATMIPEPIEFPVHDWLEDLLRRVRLN